MKPIIGITPMYDDEKQMVWLHPGYFTGVIEAGGLPIMTPWTTDKDTLVECVSKCDGILFSAGHDVLPELYGEKVLNDSVITLREKDEMEKIIIDEALKKDMPMFGICRGLQFMVAAMGGTLYQDLATQHPSNVNHRQQPPYEKPVHKVSIVKGTKLHDLAGVAELDVNSTHHQAIKDLAKDMEAMAISDDNLIEAFRDTKRKFVWGVQWHPEYDHHISEVSKKIFKEFVNACK